MTPQTPRPPIGADLMIGAGGSWLDVALLGLVALGALSGFRRGFVLEILSYGGLLFGLVIGAVMAPAVAGLFEGSDPQVRAVVSTLTVFGTGGIFQTAGFLIGSGFRAGLRIGGMARAADSIVGSVFSATALLVGAWLVSYMFVTGPSVALTSAIRESVVIASIDNVLPRPPGVIRAVRRFLDTSGFPEVFAGLDPARAAPVRAPDLSSLETEGIRAAAVSTVRVRGEACGRIQEGSGFVMAPGLVLTNAHVVAGMGDPRVQPPDGRTQPLAASTVAFDPDRDVAVLSVPGLEPAPLALFEGTVERGTPGVVLGYPQGAEQLVSAPAAVRGDVRAVGRDIYSERDVEREVYIVQADIRPGNSGGPLVATDGQVVGVIFAAAVGERELGYALTTAEVRPALAGAEGRAQAGEKVSTGGCR